MQNMAIKKNDIRSAGRCRAALALALCVGAAAFAETPDKWVSYVEATGSQWVDTGINGRWNTKIEAKVEWMEFSDSSFLAARSEVYPGNGRLYFCYCQNAEGNMFTAADTGEKVIWNGNWECRWETNRVYTYTAEFSATNGEGQATNTIKADGLSLWSKTSAGVNTGYNLYIFANNQKNNAVSQSKTRCYGMKIWQGPVDGGAMTLVRDFQPCMKGGKAGLYDACTGEIFYGLGGDLVCDENSEVPDEFIEYVESQGEAALADSQLPAYIDTGIIGRSGTKMSGEFAILASEDKGFLGSRRGNDRFYLLQSYNSKITCGYGLHKDNSNTLVLGKKYWVETELNAGSQSQKIGTDGVTNTVYSASDSTALNTDYSMCLFACKVDGNPVWFSKARCYGFKMWQDGALVRDFRPCLKNGVAGLYDDVSKRIFYSRGTPLIFDNRKAAPAKKEIVFVEYIESDGHNTLDTGVPARNNLRASGEMMWTGPKNDALETLRIWNHETYRYLENTAAAPVFFSQQRAYLAAVKATTEDRFFMVHAQNAQLDVGYGQSGEVHPESGGSRITPTIAKKYAFDITLNAGSQTLLWAEDGRELEQVWSTNATESVDTGTSLYLFSSSYWRHRSAARCYGLKIWQDGTLVRDFKPCLVDGKGMLYDEVTQSIFRPSPDIPASRTGKVVFSGEEKPARRVEYVGSDGTIFVDTDIVGKSGTAADMEMSFLETGDKGFLESRRSNTRYYLFHNGNSKGMFGYSNWYYVPASEGVGTQTASAGFAMTNGRKYRVESSLAVGAQTIKIDGALLLNESRSDNIDTGYNLYLFTCNYDGKPQYHGAARLYWLKLWQGNSDGSNMRLVRDFRPVRLSNGLVVLWDFQEKKPYLPQFVTAPYDYTTFPVVGPDGAAIVSGSTIFVR